MKKYILIITVIAASCGMSEQDRFYYYDRKFLDYSDSSFEHTKRFINCFDKHDTKGMDYEQIEADRFNDSAHKYYYLETELLKN